MEMRDAEHWATKWTQLDTPELREWMSSIASTELVANPFPTRVDIPRQGVQLFSRCVMLVLEWMLHAPAEVVAVKLFHIIPRLLLRVTPRGGVAGAKEFRARCSKFLSGRYSDLWTDERPPHTPSDVRNSEERKLARATRLAKAGHLHRAVTVAASRPLPELGARLTHTLRELHPEPQDSV